MLKLMHFTKTQISWEIRKYAHKYINKDFLKNPKLDSDQ